MAESSSLPDKRAKQLAVVSAAEPSSGRGLTSTRLLNRQGSFHFQRNIHQLVQEYEKEGNALGGLEDRIAKAVDADFPLGRPRPLPEDMDNSVVHNPSNSRIKFDKGQYCEFMGRDMKWHLARVQRVARIPKETYDPMAGKPPEFDYMYQFAGGNVFTEREVRAPEEGLKRVFGLRPWLWQQWAILKTEEFCRFQELHERDFEMMSFTMSATMLFDQWLNHPSNQDFRDLYYSRPAEERAKLRHHMATPFVLIDAISRKDGVEPWSFKDSGVSIYVYLSVLGAGWFTALAVLGIQLLIPAMLLYAAIIRSPRIDTVNGSSFDQFCAKDGPIDGLIVNMCVIVFYALRQVPMVVYTFFETAGEAESARSRLASLRTVVWEKGRDSLAMQFGYKMDKYMNSTYIALINNIMLFVLFLQDSPSEIILDAIAIEFVVYFAREVANAIWLDPNTRYLRAGAIELVMRTVVNMRTLGNARKLCERFEIDYNEFAEAVKGDGFSVSSALCNYKLAVRDMADPKYNTPKDFVWKMAEKWARQSGNKVALWVFERKPVYFDTGAQWLSLLGIERDPLFEQFNEFHTWSRWDKVLFMSPCTKVKKLEDGNSYEVVEEHLPHVLASVKEELEDPRKSTMAKWLNTRVPYLNEDPRVEKDVATRFLLDIIKTLSFHYYVQSLRNAIKERSPISFVFRSIDGLFEWLAYFYLVIFPFTLIGYVVLLLNCY